MPRHLTPSARRGIGVLLGLAARRREVGMDDWGWQELEPWLIARVTLPCRASTTRLSLSS